MSGQFQYGQASSATPDTTASRWSDVTIQFECAGRLGRRKADPCGHLLLTRKGLEFYGVLEVNVVWPHVMGVDRSERSIVVSLLSTSALEIAATTFGGPSLHFCCASADDAVRGVAVARDLLAALGPLGTRSAAALA